MLKINQSYELQAELYALSVVHVHTLVCLLHRVSLLNEDKARENATGHHYQGNKHSHHDTRNDTNLRCCKAGTCTYKNMTVTEDGNI